MEGLEELLLASVSGHVHSVPSDVFLLFSSFSSDDELWEIICDTTSFRFVSDLIPKT